MDGKAAGLLPWRKTLALFILPSALEEDRICFPKLCSLYKHPQKDSLKQKDPECLCLQNVQGCVRPIKNCFPAPGRSGNSKCFRWNMNFSLGLSEILTTKLQHWLHQGVAVSTSLHLGRSWLLLACFLLSLLPNRAAQCFGWRGRITLDLKKQFWNQVTWVQSQLCQLTE